MNGMRNRSRLVGGLVAALAFVLAAPLRAQADWTDFLPRPFGADVTVPGRGT